MNISEDGIMNGISQTTSSPMPNCTSGYHNVTLPKTEHYGKCEWMEFAFLLILIICGVIGNRLVLMVYRPQRLQRPQATIFFIRQLAIVDLGTSMFLMPLSAGLMDLAGKIYDYHGVWFAVECQKLYTSICAIYWFIVCVEIVLNFTILASCMILIGIAWDIYDAVQHPTRNYFRICGRELGREKVSAYYLAISFTIMFLFSIVFRLNDVPGWGLDKPDVTSNITSNATSIGGCGEEGKPYSTVRLIFEVIVYSTLAICVVCYVITGWRLHRLIRERMARAERRARNDRLVASSSASLNAIPPLGPEVELDARGEARDLSSPPRNEWKELTPVVVNERVAANDSNNDNDNNDNNDNNNDDSSNGSSSKRLAMEMPILKRLVDADPSTNAMALNDDSSIPGRRGGCGGGADGGGGGGDDGGGEGYLRRANEEEKRVVEEEEEEKDDSSRASLRRAAEVLNPTGVTFRLGQDSWELGESGNVDGGRNTGGRAHSTPIAGHPSHAKSSPSILMDSNRRGRKSQTVATVSTTAEITEAPITTTTTTTTEGILKKLTRSLSGMNISWSTSNSNNINSGHVEGPVEGRTRARSTFSNHVAAQERMFKVAILVFLLFVISYIPSFLMHHWCKLPIYPVIGKFYYLPSALNPVIYSLTKTKFRRDAKFHIKMILQGKFGARERARALTVSGI